MADQETVPAAAPKNKGGRPKGARTKKLVDLNSADGQAMISKLVDDRMESLVARLTAKREEAGTQDVGGDGDMKLMRHLAIAIAEISDQDGKKRRVAPEEMEARAAALQKMEDLIIDAVANNKIAVYRLTREVYLGDQLIPSTYVDAQHVRRPQEIEWDGAPNEAMEPVNEVAAEIHAAFIRSIGGRTKEAKVNYNKATDRPGLRVLTQDPRTQRAPEIGNGRQRHDTPGLRVMRPGMPGEASQTRVLGTIAEPARQVG